MREKQYICVINPYENSMLLTTLHYAYEIRSLAEIPNLKQQPQKLSAPELKLAQDLIASLTRKKFAIAQFKDTFAQQLKAALRSAQKQKVTKKKKDKAGGPAKKQKEKSSLMIALRASLKAPGKNSFVAYAKKGKRK